MPRTATSFRCARIAFAVLTAAMLLPQAAVGAPQCQAHSGPATAILVELYTSGHCSGCEKAERWLAGVRVRGYGPGQLVPLTLHVDSRDYSGSDPQAARPISQRQGRLSLLQRMALVYTPQVLVQGREFPDWSGGSFDQAAARINRAPAKANIFLRLSGGEAGYFEVEAAAEVASAAADDPVLYLAAYQERFDGPTAQETTILQWQGPLPFGGAHRLEARRSLLLLPKARASDSGVAAFVQDRRTGEVLQALMLKACWP